MRLVSIEDLQKLNELGQAASPSHAKRMAALAQARAVRERILAEREGLFLTDVAEDLRRLREERDLELTGQQGRKRSEVMSVD